MSGFAVVAPAEDRVRVLASYHAKRLPDDHVLFYLRFDRALHAGYRLGGDWPPVYRRWRAPAEGSGRD